MHARITTARRTVRLLAGVLATFALLVGCILPSAVAAASGPASVHGTGTWTNLATEPCSPIPFDPAPNVNFACRGISHWAGQVLTGTTVYTTIGAFDAATGNIVGRIDETFTGSATNGAHGTIHFKEFISIADDGTHTGAGSLFIFAEAVGGTGGFCHVKGHLVFTGTVNADGTGTGPFSGQIVTPKDCK
jgi:ABC-type transport system substrate-binding protein